MLKGNLRHCFANRVLGRVRQSLSLLCAAAVLITSIVGAVSVSAEDSYAFPINFEGGKNPMPAVTNTYSGKEHVTTDGVTLLTGADVLNGGGSLSLKIRSGNTRTELKNIEMAPVADFSKKEFEKVTGIMLRLKLNNDTGTAVHKFSLVLSQDGVAGNTNLARGVAAFDANGTAVKLTGTKDTEIRLPAKFDGFIFLPLESACSDTKTKTGIADRYGTFPSSMVDLAKNFRLTVRFDGSNWKNIEVCLDDLCIYSGTQETDHLKLIKNLGYDIAVDIPPDQPGEDPGEYLPAADPQPDRYDFPFVFDDGILPFNRIIDIDGSWSTSTRTGDIGLVGEGKALIGSAALEVAGLRRTNNRTDLNNAPMNGISGFSKTDFEAVTGVMMRLKLIGGNADSQYMIALTASQSGVRLTHLGKGAAAYDLTGKPVTLGGGNLGVKIPGNFDGYLFLPFKTAQSETVTVAGTYDSYVDYPESMVDFSKDYLLTLCFKGAPFGGDPWDCSVLIDDMQIYSGNEHVNILKAQYDGITYVQQPERYCFPLPFDDGLMPFTAIDDVYDWKVHWKDTGISLTAEEALIGTASVKLDPLREGNNRTDLNDVKMAGIEGFSKTDFGTATGILLRLKLTGGKSSPKRFSITATQSGVTRTYLGKGAVAYDLSGKEIMLHGGNLGVKLPGNFDGYLFLPFKTAQSETVTVAGTYDSYVDFPQSMVDFSRDYTMTVMFFDEVGGEWGGTAVLMDDLRVYSGNEHINILKSLYGGITNVQQPDCYTLPLTFDDGLMPFTAIDDVYDWKVHWKTDGLSLVTGAEALSGTTSVKIDALRAGNNRTDLNEVKMSGIEGFSKTDFSKATGIMIRMKITGGDAGAVKTFRIAANQNGLGKMTFLGKGACAYDLEGNKLALVDTNLGVKLPGDFDGYVFLPFATAQSETVTVPGTYDNYADFPEHLADFSQDWNMTLMFWGGEWDNSTVVFDDLLLYSGEQHITILKSLYSGIKTVQQPEYYDFPIAFEKGMTPFSFGLDGGKWVQMKNEYGTGAQLSYGKNSIGGGFTIKFANDLTDAYSVYTSKAKVQVPQGAIGFMLRVKTDAPESATLGILTDNWTKSSLQFGKNALLYDLEGNLVEKPFESKHWLGCNLPGEFDGFIFIPFANGFNEAQQKYYNEATGVKLNQKTVDLQLIFYGEEVWQGKTFELQLLGVYQDTNYVGTIEKLGYELDVEKGLTRQDILGAASKLFFYMQRINDGFDEKSISKLKNWDFLDTDGGKLLNSYSSSNVEIGNGLLTLKYSDTAKDGKKYTAGAMRTKQKYTYGYYETNMTIPKLAGTKTVFRLVTEGSYDQGGTAFEIDIAYLNEQYELMTGYKYMSDYKALKDGGTVADGEEKVDTRDDFAGVAHTYGLLYTYNYLRFYVDGVLVREIENTFARGGVYIEIAGTVVSEITEPITPSNAEIVVDYVRYWEIDQDEMAKYDVALLSASNADGISEDSEVIRADNTSVALIIAVCAAGLGALCLVGLVIFSFRRKKDSL